MYAEAAFVAFGLYVKAEYKWASAQPTWPTEGKYKRYHACTLPHQAHNYQNDAKEVLVDFATTIVEHEGEQFLKAAIEEFKEEVAKGRGFLRGVLEATTGAFVWSVIVTTIIAGRLGIDVIGAFERAASETHSTQVPPQH